MTRCRAFEAVVAVMLMSWGAGCATSDPGDQPCQSDADCSAGEVCDQEAMQCVRASIVTNNGTPPPNDADNNNGIEPDMGDVEDGTTPDDDADVIVEPDAGPDMTDPVTCVPACGADQVCDNGQCVSACMPACTAPEVCTETGCEIPDCAAAGDPCDASRREQGDYGCATDGSGGNGVCLAKCDEPYVAANCAQGEYCWEIGTLDLCVPTECVTDADCPDQGTCVALDNAYSACFSSGMIPVGGACDPSGAGAQDPANRCAQGALCRQTTGPTNGVCSQTCDPFAAAPACPTNELCSHMYTTRTALCSSDIDSTGTGPYQACSSIGAGCDDAVECFAVSATQNGCFAYCRPGENDCAEANLVTPSACNNYVFAGVREVGLCFAECATAQDCGGPGNVCVNNICRRSCTDDTTCCPSGPPCAFTCGPDNLCE